MLQNFAPDKLVLIKFVSSRLEFVKSTPLKSAFSKFAPFRFTLTRLEFLNLEFVNTAPSKSLLNIETSDKLNKSVFIPKGKKAKNVDGDYNEINSFNSVKDEFEAIAGIVALAEDWEDADAGK